MNHDNTLRAVVRVGYGLGFWLSNAASGIRGGVSGSPIVTDDGAAIGVVCLSSGTNLDTDQNTEGGPNPRLLAHLPGWLWQQIRPRDENRML